MGSIKSFVNFELNVFESGLGPKLMAKLAIQVRINDISGDGWQLLIHLFIGLNLPKFDHLRQKGSTLLMKLSNTASYFRLYSGRLLALICWFWNLEGV